MNTIPKHWHEMRLKDLVLSNKGKKPLKLEKFAFSNSIPYLDIEALENANIRFYADTLSTTQATDKDIFVVADGSRSGLVAKGVFGAVGSTILRLTPLVINQDYLYYYLTANYEYLNKNTTGASIPHLNTKLFNNLSVPIPPLEEQEKISTDLKNKLSEYEKQSLSNESEINNIQQFQKSILDQAVTGELTSKWREVNAGEINGAEKDLYELNPEAEILQDENSRFEIPSSWVLTNAISICSKITDGEHQTPNKLTKGALLLGAKNIRNGFIDYENVEYISEVDLEKFRNRCNPELNDVLLVSIGATIGRVSVITENIRFALTRNVLLLKPMISGKYLMYILQSPILQDLIKESSRGVAQAALYINETGHLPIPFPPIIEQEEIVRQIEYHITGASKIESNIAEAKQQIALLKGSIFQMAFSGKMSEPVIPKNNWFTDFKSAIAEMKRAIEIDNKKIILKRKANMATFKSGLQSRKSIVEILRATPGHVLPVDELWQQSMQFEEIDIEGFYEELDKCLSNGNGEATISWQFDPNNKNVALLKLS